MTLKEQTVLYLHVVIVVFLLMLKVYFANFGLGKARGQAGVRALEDSASVESLGLPQQQGFAREAAGSDSKVDEHAKVNEEAMARSMRVIANDMENIPIFLFVFLLHTWVLLNGDTIAQTTSFSAKADRFTAPTQWLQIIVGYVFFVARALHTYFYLKGVQGPAALRSLAFFVGFLATLTLAVSLLINIITQTLFVNEHF
jgi:uncharacterized MAPEG superfamily protein